MVAGDIQLARKLKADGFHAPEYMLSQRSRLKALSPTWLTTTSVHSKQALLKAQKAGLDAAFASPVFATKSHPGSPHLGLNRLRTWALDSQMPLYALGGINRQNHAELRTSYVAGLAGIGLLQET